MKLRACEGNSAGNVTEPRAAAARLSKADTERDAMRRTIAEMPILRGLIAAAAFAGCAAAAHAERPFPVADPGTLEENARQPLCCDVPPRGEAPADHVFGRWVVVHAGIGAPMRAGEQVEFRDDGGLATPRGLCRFAVLRAELTIACAGKADVGDIRFEDDTKLIWRHEGRETIFIAPAN